ncbi:MAG TPA: serine hydrolase domain-containing protein [Thermoanaerobaculia bacterium]|nr:serine hydrolase domain-containing protein [Thermoanaerobaculia bacterium]
MRRRIARFGGWAAAGILGIGMGSGAEAQTSFCTSQLELLNEYVGPLVKPVSSEKGMDGQAVGVVGVTLKLGEAPCFFRGGEKALGAGPPDANTIFELASITKVFTTAILALRSQQFFPVDSSVETYLPPDYDLQTNEQEVTFQQLATFTGGFTWDQPPDFNWKDGYTQARFVKQVNKLDPQKKFNGVTYLPTQDFYSNGSIGLLGQILMYSDAGKKGEEYHHADGFSKWISRNLTGPLDMPNTAVEPAWSDWAQGYKEEGDGSYEKLDGFPWVPWGPAGALRSNANDMLKFLEANICAYHRGNTACNGVPLDILDALPVAHEANTYIPVGYLSDPKIYIGKSETLEQGWAWRVAPPPDPNPNGVTTIISKDGGHPGFSTYIGFNPHKKYGIVILMNTGHVLAKKAGLEVIKHTN